MGHDWSDLQIRGSLLEGRPRRFKCIFLITICSVPLLNSRSTTVARPLIEVGRATVDRPVGLGRARSGYRFELGTELIPE